MPLNSVVQVEPGKLAHSFLPWAWGYRGADVFQDPPWAALDVSQPATIASQALSKGFVAFQAHHDEPFIMGGEVEPDDLKTIRQAWKVNGQKVFDTGLRLEMIAPRLWGRAKFRNGALTSTDPDVRQLALGICKLCLDVLAEYNATYEDGQAYLLFWLAREGQFIRGADLDRAERWKLLVEAMMELQAYNAAVRIGMEPKPEDPVESAVIRSGNDVLALAGQLQRPEQLGVLVEIAHCVLANGDPAQEIAVLASRNKLLGIHANDQERAMIDRDLPFGMANPLRGLEIMLQLRIHGWFDGHHYIGHDVKSPNCADEAHRDGGIEASREMATLLWNIAQQVDVEEWRRLAREDPVQGSLYLNRLLMYDVDDV